ncbi:hypothetical protein ATCC90586_003145 [Pythium insidiosum]|nr:hypothetical protein ATCC90586_003145 [Pythium insidiosum]
MPVETEPKPPAAASKQEEARAPQPLPPPPPVAVPGGHDAASAAAAPKTSLKTDLRVVTDMGPPSSLALRSPTSLLLSPLGAMIGLKPGDAPPSSPTLPKDLPFDPRFLADAWSQESPQSVYAFLTQPSTAQLHGFSPLAISPGGMRLLSPTMASQQHHQGSFSAQLHSVGTQISPLGAGRGLQQHFFPPSLSLPPSPHYAQLSHSQLLSPVFSTMSSAAASASSFVATSSAATTSASAATSSPTTTQDFLGLVDPSTVFAATPQSPASGMHLLPPIAPRPSPLNVKELTLNELRPHFNKPMAVVAKELGVCITLMKKICRRNGLVRWPHRRIRSLVNRITSLQVIASNSTGAEKKRFQSQIISLREELSAVIQNPNEKSRKAQADAKTRSPVHATSKRPKKAPSRQKASRPSDEDDDYDDDDPFFPASAVDDCENADSRNTPPDTLGDDAVRKTRRSSSKAMSKATTPLGETSTSKSKKRKAGFRATIVPPPPIKIPCAASRSRREDGPADDMPWSTRSTPSSGGKRGSISSILCEGL